MPKHSVLRKPQSPPDPGGRAGVVRTQKAIPTMTQAQVVYQEVPPALRPTLCCGRCGHCDVHPCQLHTSV